MQRTTAVSGFYLDDGEGTLWPVFVRAYSTGGPDAVTGVETVPDEDRPPVPHERLTLLRRGELLPSEIERVERQMVAYALRRAPMNPPDFTEGDREVFDRLAQRFDPRP